MTRDQVAGISTPAVIVADRWGEIVYVAVSSDAGGLPPAEALADWLTYVQHQCPECEGETK
jgi:hypothetical protein